MQGATTQRFQFGGSKAIGICAKLRRPRRPDQAPDDPWVAGTDFSWLLSLAYHWHEQFNWRAQDARLTGFDQYPVKTNSDVGLQYLHVPGFLRRPTPRPMGPSRYGDTPEDTFTVIVPNQPCFGPSLQPVQLRSSVEKIADVLVDRRPCTPGGDRGAPIEWAAYMKRHCVGPTFEPAAAVRRPSMVEGNGPAEHACVMAMPTWWHEELSYKSLMVTRRRRWSKCSRTRLSGRDEWITKRLRAWSACGDGLNSIFLMGDIQANVSSYCFSEAIGSSFWPYDARRHGPWPIPDGYNADVTVSFHDFTNEIILPQRARAECNFTDIRPRSVTPQGRHFVAPEQPEASASEIRAFYHPRKRSRL